MDANTPDAFFRQMPVVTRAIVTATFCVTLLSTLGIFNVSYLFLDWVLVTKKFHLWRLVTDYLFIGQFSFGWLFHMYFFSSYSSRLEKNEVFTSRLGGSGSFLYFLFLQMISLDVLSLLFYYPRGKPVLGASLSFAVIYYWSKREPFTQVGLWGFTLMAWQLPYVLLVLDLLMGQSIWHDLMGLMTGHLYYFVKDILPHEKNIKLLGPVPNIFGYLTEKMDFMSNSSASSFTRPGGGASTAASSRQQNRFSSLFGNRESAEGAPFTGRGYRLGDSSQTGGGSSSAS